MSCEITTICKDSEKRLSTKYVIYDNQTHNGQPVTASLEDPTIKDCIAKSMENFKSETDDIDVKVRIDIMVQ